MKYNKNNSSRFSDDVLNKHIKEKIGYLNDLKKQFGYSQDLINKLALMNVALKENYYEIDELFYNTLMKTQIFISNDNINDLYKKAMGVYENLDPSLLGLYERSLSFNVFNHDYKSKPAKIFIAKKRRDEVLSNTDVYCSMIHEIRHALMAQIDGEGFINENTYFSRSGIRLYLLLKDKGYAVIGSKINEAYNETASIKLINTTLKYKNSSIKNMNVKHFLNSLKEGLKNGKYISDSYLLERTILSPILKNKDIQEIVNEVELNGDLDQFFDLFENFNSYSNEFEDLIDYFHEKGYTQEFKVNLENFSVKTNEIAKYKS